ncbi:MAG: beta-lactamase family protein, partial [Propionibacteriaceae bacterium]|nr:beta-lactamase family protein [Propionibacteriaceae bacterium]
IDTGRGDDSLEKYMTVLESAVQLFPVGASWSYCNTGYSIMGRVIQVVTGQVWEDAMRERLFAPLGLTHTVTLPEDALLFDTAVGHSAGAPDPKVIGRWCLDRDNGPAGSITASVADLLTFARLHLCDGVTTDGTRLLSPESMAAMHAFSSDVPTGQLTGESWGLGFTRFNWGGAQVFGHDGNTIGQSAFLRIYPAGRLAVGLMVTGPGVHPLYQTLFGEIFAELCGVTIRPPMQLPDEPADLDITPWVGTYERDEVRIEIIDEPEGPLFRSTERGELAEIYGNPVIECRMTPIREGLYGLYEDDRKMSLPVLLFQLTGGDRYVHFSSRSTRKTCGSM